jgi:hypothetical protein
MTPPGRFEEIVGAAVCVPESVPPAGEIVGGASLRTLMESLVVVVEESVATRVTQRESRESPLKETELE